VCIHKNISSCVAGAGAGAGPAITCSFPLQVLGKMLGAIRDTEEPKGLDGTGTGMTTPSAIFLCPVW
jgi:hypothetical protein